jgi:hypothetical protein
MVTEAPINPYESSPRAPSQSMNVNCHEWQGHSICVEANAFPHSLWQVGAFHVVVDGQHRFTSKKITLIECFDWEFAHENTTAKGRFAAMGLNNGLWQKYRLTINGEHIGEGRVPIRDGWKGIVAIVVLFAIVGALAALILYLLTRNN